MPIDNLVVAGLIAFLLADGPARAMEPSALAAVRVVDAGDSE